MAYFNTIHTRAQANNEYRFISSGKYLKKFYITNNDNCMTHSTKYMVGKIGKLFKGIFAPLPLDDDIKMVQYILKIY